jgi:thymidylate synthase ThyX
MNRTFFFASFIKIKCKNDIQKEHREIANGVRTIFTKEFPTIAEALQDIS